VKILIAALTACVLFAAGCNKSADNNGVNDSIAFESRYEGLAAQSTLITGATILTGTGERLDNADLLLVDGKIAEIGTGLGAAGADVVDAEGKWVTPGVIDVHSHLGVYASPGTTSHSDGNEATAPVTAQVWAEHSVWPNDPGFTTALAGGVTAMQILPGSANLIGGRGVTLKNGLRRKSQTRLRRSRPGAGYSHG
jgi:imidazolonepropionase-like amidohydrolase